MCKQYYCYYKVRHLGGGSLWLHRWLFVSVLFHVKIQFLLLFKEGIYFGVSFHKGSRWPNLFSLKLKKVMRNELEFFDESGFMPPEKC